MARVLDLVKGVLSSGARYYIYPGHFHSHSRQNILHPSRYGLRSYEEFFLHARDGTKLHAYLLLQPTKEEILDFRGTFGDDDNDPEGYKCAHQRPTILIFHGNSGNIGNWLAHARRFYRAMKCNVLLVEYRGYGKSEGRPTQDGIRLDAEAALDFIEDHISLAGTPVYLYGQSLGAAIAIDLATRRPDRITALILENPFLSLPKLISHRFPALSPLVPVLVPWACKGEVWDSEGLVNTWGGEQETGVCYHGKPKTRKGCRDSSLSTVSQASTSSSSSAETSASTASCGSTSKLNSKHSVDCAAITYSSSTLLSSSSSMTPHNRPRILFLSGSRDAIVPPRHTAELARAFVRAFAQGCRKTAECRIPENEESTKKPQHEKEGQKRRKLVKNPPSSYSYSSSRSSFKSHNRDSSSLYSFNLVSEKAQSKDKRKSLASDRKGSGSDLNSEARVQVACFKHGGHNDMASQPGYWETIAEFVNALAGGVADLPYHPSKDNNGKNKTETIGEIEEEKIVPTEEELESVLLPTMTIGADVTETQSRAPPPLYTP